MPASFIALHIPTNLMTSLQKNVKLTPHLKSLPPRESRGGARNVIPAQAGIQKYFVFSVVNIGIENNIISKITVDSQIQ